MSRNELTQLPSDDLSYLTVFVIDDDPAIRQSVTATLRPLEFNVDEYASAEDFLESWDGPRPGVLVLDVRMNGMSGIELQRRLAMAHPYLGVIIVTGHATVAMSVSAIKQGAVDFLEKPYAPEKLRSIIAMAMERAALRWIQHQQRETYDVLKRELSPRECEVYELLTEGHENKQIARMLAISASTVEKHRLSVVRKMGVDNITHLLRQKYEANGS